MTLNVIRFAIKNEDTFKELQNYFKKTVNISSEQGRGVIKYSGNRNDDNSIFIGSCHKLGLRVLTFSNDNGAVELDKFRGDFINVTKNNEHVKNLSVTSFETTNVQFKHGPLVNINDFALAATNTVQSQQKTVPRISFENNVLYIGGKAGACCVAIKVTTNADQTVRYIVTTMKAKEKSCNVFWKSLQNSISSSTIAVLGACIVNQISRATQSPLLNAIVKHITKNNDLGKVIVSQQELSRSTTKSGKYVIRALSGIKGKLHSDQTSLEAQELFLLWFMRVFVAEKHFKSGTLLNASTFEFKLTEITSDSEWTTGCATRYKNAKADPDG